MNTVDTIMVADIMAREFNPDAPIVLGLSGDVGTGKTSTADFFAPQAGMGRRHVFNHGFQIRWSHMFFALPLQAMVSVRRGIEGPMARDRMKYEIHDILLDLFGKSPIYGAPSYEQLIEMVNEIATYPVPYDGKARSFLHHVGTDMVREYSEDTFVKWMRRKIRSEYQRMMHDARDELSDLEGDDVEYLDDPFHRVAFGVVVSDVRFPNEAELIKSYDNGILIGMTAREEVRRERLKARDGHSIAPEEENHRAESSMKLIDNQLYDIIIDTSDIELEDQVNLVREIVENFVEAE